MSAVLPPLFGPITIVSGRTSIQVVSSKERKFVHLRWNGSTTHTLGQEWTPVPVAQGCNLLPVVRARAEASADTFESVESRGKVAYRAGSPAPPEAEVGPITGRHWRSPSTQMRTRRVRAVQPRLTQHLPAPLGVLRLLPEDASCGSPGG